MGEHAAHNRDEGVQLEREPIVHSCHPFTRTDHLGPLVGLRSLYALCCLTATLLLAQAAQASGGYGFPRHEVFVHQVALQYQLNHGPLQLALKLLGSSAHLPPVVVRCTGEVAVTLAGNSPGFERIRCTTSQRVPDYLYTLDARGHEHIARVPSD